MLCNILTLISFSRHCDVWLCVLCVVCALFFFFFAFFIIIIIFYVNFLLPVRSLFFMIIRRTCVMVLCNQIIQCVFFWHFFSVRGTPVFPAKWRKKAKGNKKEKKNTNKIYHLEGNICRWYELSACGSQSMYEWNDILDRNLWTY